VQPDRRSTPANVEGTAAIVGQTLENLGLEQLDLFLIHWPVPTLYDGDYISTWRAMIDLVKGGRLRTAGVSNFQPEHLDRIVGATGGACCESNRSASILQQ
jgi:diketogulonate reductase-like aldo/keto reductase